MNGRILRMAVVSASAVAMPLYLAAQTSMDPTGTNPGMTQPTVGPQNNNNGPGSNAPITPAAGTMRDSLGAPGETGQQLRDEQFLKKAGSGGYAEVQIGTLATQKGSSDVKDFAQKMVADHTQINKQMGDVADQMGVQIPKKMSKEDKAEYDKLASLNGDAFDKEYIAFLLKDHRENLREFRMEASVASDQNLQEAVVDAARTIRAHMQATVKLAQEKGVPVPPRPQRPATAGQ